MPSLSSIRDVVEAALAHGLPMRYTLPDRRAAVAWRHQFYRWRRSVASPVFQAVELGTTSDPCTWELRHAPAGILTTPEGDALPPPKPRLTIDQLAGLSIEIEPSDE